jgi:peptidoglycan/LPS O-acetylase OafA/YrhL
MEALVRLFRRETSSTEFIPVIDGLRFLAIAMVVLYHTNLFIQEKSSSLNFAESAYYPSANILVFGHQGVELFFVISGFILAMPFMRQRFGLTEREFSLKRYFLRRLTRLEPPYIVSTLLLFLILALVIKDKYPISDLAASLFTSFFYLNNIVFPDEPARINSVTWSLEIEVQFYILAPFLVWALGAIRNKVIRRVCILGLIVAFAYLSWLFETVWPAQIPLCIGYFFQYFLAGILLCDLYLLDLAKSARFDGTVFLVVGALLLVFIVSVEHARSPFIVLKIVSPLAILFFYAIVFTNRYWSRLFSVDTLTLIGGMCYTVYLLHYATIAAVGRITVTNVGISNFYFYFAIQAFVYILAILAVSSVFFLLIEKPCMKSDWYIKLFENLRTWFPSPKANENVVKRMPLRDDERG